MRILPKVYLFLACFKVSFGDPHLAQPGQVQAVLLPWEAVLSSAWAQSISRRACVSSSLQVTDKVGLTGGIGEL